MLTEEEGKRGLELARAAITEYLRTNTKISAPTDLSPRFDEYRGVFVTLKVFGALRGCIGFPYPAFPLKEAIVEAAISAAVGDPRFPAVTLHEFKDVSIELTVLTLPQVLKVKPQEMPRHIAVGRHGLIVKRGIQTGLLLPQVATEFGWDAEEFLCQTCWKAGVPQDAWLNEETEVSTFEGQIFSEETT
ncbi:MAG: TIGR00296 family protein [Methanomicrobia archaeon]|nr:TIGR00296 family protein [Methanomicrobia archaeon]